jgi:mRNA-degrading endonuclease toxin of MazEF toxin-antitoxin module
MVEQGDIIKINGIGQLAAVISKNSYNETGMAVVCPVVLEKTFSTFEVEIKVDETVMYVASDGLRQLDLESRKYKYVARLPYSKLIYVIDKAQSVLDYY